MKMITYQQYSAMRTLWKAGLAFLATLGVSVASLQAVELPEDVSALQAGLAPLLLSLAVGLAKAIENTRKNFNGNGLSLWRWPWEKRVAPCWFLAVAVGLCLTASGCVTGQGLGNKVKYEVEFKNNTPGEMTPDGFPTDGELTEYRASWTGQPGEVMEAASAMGIQVNADQSWSIDVGQSAKRDSTAQAQMLQAIGQMQADTAGRIVDSAVKAAVEAWLPSDLARTEAGVAKRQIRGDTIRHGMDTVGGIVQRVAPPAGAHTCPTCQGAGVVPEDTKK